jgi:tRNA (adenine22-N1)-methyltransferase
MKLSKRLQKIADLVGEGSIVADIGTDHGYIPAYLIESGKSKKVIGSDISKGSLDKIIQYVKQLNLEENIETRLGNGLEVLEPNEVDTVIIAGMGGILMQDILHKNLEITNSITHFILQPMIAAKELREYLIHNNFKIIDEELVKEEKIFYEIIYAVKGESKIEEGLSYEISPILFEKNHPLLVEYIEYKINVANSIRIGLQEKKSSKSQLRYLELTELIESYKEAIKNIKS